MAYQTRREPLLDSRMSEALEKRGKELIGLALIGLALAVGAMVYSYSPADPSWMTVTDGPVRNWLGAPGASVAAPLFMILGWGVWSLAIVPGAWGLRLVAHRGAARAPGRLIFAPVWLALLSLHAATLAPGTVWAAQHSFGLGGLFGDMALGTLLGVLPFDPGLGLRLASLALGALVVGGGLFVLGFDRAELRRILRFVILGTVLGYSALRGALARGATVMMRAGQGIRARRAARRTAPEGAHRTASAGAVRSEPVLDARHSAQAATGPVADAAAPEKTGGLLGRMPGLLRKTETMPDPELIEPDTDGVAPDAPPADRIRARISDVVRERRRAETEPPLTKGRGTDPLVRGSGALPPEPPLTAGTSGPPVSGADPEDVPAAPPRPPVAEPRKVVQHTAARPAAPSSRAQAEAQPALAFESADPGYELPPLSLLSDPATIERHHLSDAALAENARMLENVLDDYGVKGEIVSVRPDVRTRTRAGPQGVARHRACRRYRALDGGAFGAGLDGAGAVGDRDRAAQ